MDNRLPQQILDLYARAWDRAGFSAQTSPLLQADLYAWIMENHESGHGIMELGCLSGGCTITLAYAAAQLKHPLVVIDTNEQNIEDTCRTVIDLGIVDDVISFRGTLREFLKRLPPKKRPLLCFIDGDHDYLAVRNDIDSIYSLPPALRPYGLAFHDFSLRSNVHEDTAVDDAICDAFGQHVVYERIGVQHGSTPVPSKEHPADNGCWWKANGTEGALIETKHYPAIRPLGVRRV